MKEDQSAQRETINDSIRQLKDALDGKYKLAKIDYAAPSPDGCYAVLYAQFNDSFENSLVVSPTRKPGWVEITNCQGSYQEEGYPTTKWRKKIRYNGLDDLVDFFHKCYCQMVKSTKEFENEEYETLKNVGMSDFEIDQEFQRTEYD